MTIDDVRARLDKIQAFADARDHEQAHGEEDDLWLAVLLAVADGAQNAAALAGEALKSRFIEHRRHCA